MSCSVVGVHVAAAGLHAERAAVCAVRVALAAFAAQGHRVSEGRVHPCWAARQLHCLIGPLPEVAGVLNIWHHWTTVSPFLCLAEAGAGCGVNGDAAAAFLALHSDGNIGKAATGLAFW